MTAPQDPFSAPGPERPADAAGPPAPPPGWGPPPGDGQAPGYGAPQAYGQPAQFGATPYGTAPASKSNGLGVTALVLGIIALLFSWAGGGLLGIVAIVLGVLGRGKAKRGEADNGGMALAGIITGVVSVLITAAVIAAGVALFNSDSGQDLIDCLNDAGNSAEAQQACQREFEQDFTR